MVLKGVLRDVHVFAFIYHKCSPALSQRMNEGGKKKLEKEEEEEEGKEEGKKPPQIKKIKKVVEGGRGEMKNCLTRTVFFRGIPFFLIMGRGFLSDGVNIT